MPTVPIKSYATAARTVAAMMFALAFMLEQIWNIYVEEETWYPPTNHQHHQTSVDTVPAELASRISPGYILGQTLLHLTTYLIPKLNFVT